VLDGNNAGSRRLPRQFWPGLAIPNISDVSGRRRPGMVADFHAAGWAPAHHHFGEGQRLSDLEIAEVPGCVATALAVDRDRGRVVLVDLASGELLLDWQSCDGRPLSAALDVRGQRLLIGLESGELRAMDLSGPLRALDGMSAERVQARVGLVRDASGRVRSARAPGTGGDHPNPETIASAGADMETLAEFDRLRNDARSALNDGPSKKAADLLDKLAALGERNTLVALEKRLGRRCLTCAADLLVARAKTKQGDWRAAQIVIGRVIPRLASWPSDRIANDAIVALAETAQAALKDGEREASRAMAYPAAFLVNERSDWKELSFRSVFSVFSALLADYRKHASDDAERRLAGLADRTGLLNHVRRLSPTNVPTMETAALFFERVALTTYAELQQPRDYAEAAKKLAQAYGTWDAALERTDGFGERRRDVLERKLEALAGTALQLTRFAMKLDTPSRTAQDDELLTRHILPGITALAEQCLYDANTYSGVFERSPERRLTRACQETHQMAEMIGAKRQ
jgi:hypothetical protein